MTLKLLMLEDDPADVLLLKRHLKKSGIDTELTVISTADELRQEAQRGTHDLAIIDYNLPTIQAPEALDIISGLDVDLPTLVISGYVDEHAAVTVMRHGARDFISKDRLARLGPAIEREIASARERAERARMQQQLQLADRMASLGTLATGIAHEINNPLAAILLNLDLLVDHHQRISCELEDEDVLLVQCGDGLRDIREAAWKIRDIVSELRLFAHTEQDPKAKRVPVDIHAVLENSLKLANNALRHNARITRSFAPNLPPALADPARLGQVLLNLVINALQAMPEGATRENQLRIITSHEPRNDTLVITIQDNGCGIEPHILGRIFDPFFTTKSPGVGTGLGLSICHSLIENMRGSIEVASTLDVGTTFTVRLPATERISTATPTTQPKPAAKSLDDEEKRILVIDDDALLLGLMVRTLKRHYLVSSTQSATEALAWLQEGARYDLILCDLMMPELSGTDFYDALLALAPAQAERVIFTTGGVFSERGRALIEEHAERVLHKPFEFEALHALVEARLEATPRPKTVPD